LSGKTIIVNAGHGYKETGRIDCGADYSSNNIPDEWIVNHRNALELTSRLQAQGAKVIFMQGFRSLVINEFSKEGNKADLFISLHANAAGKNAKDRTQFYCYEDVKDKNNKQKSIKLSEMAEQKFNSWIPQNEQIVETDKFYSHKKAVYAESKITNKRVGILNCAINKLHSPAMLWEVGFGTSKKGAERLNDEELMENYMKLMTETIVEFFQK
jgi:N-acetylmuramoyl-L-alanine amidase